MAAFQKCVASETPPSAQSFASLLTVLDAANTWQMAIRIYAVIPVQVGCSPHSTDHAYVGSR